MVELTPYIGGIYISFITFFLALASPGPNILAVISASLNYGRNDAYLVASGIAFGSLTWSLTSIFGLSLLLIQFQYSIVLIKIFGGFYLLYLSYQVFLSSRNKFDLSVDSAARVSNVKMFARGYIVMMTNPKAPLAWIAIVSLGMQEGAPISIGFIISLGTFVISIFVHLLYAYSFTTKSMLLLYSKYRNRIQFVLSLFFAVAGLSLLIY